MFQTIFNEVNRFESSFEEFNNNIEIIPIIPKP